MVVAPILDMGDGEAAIARLDAERQHADQAAAAAHLGNADVAPLAHGRQRGGDEPMFGKAIGLGRECGERAPFVGERGDRLGGGAQDGGRDGQKIESGRRHAFPIRRHSDPAHRTHRARDSAER